MRSFTFREVERDEFNAFSAQHPQGNFQQTTGMGDVREAEGVQIWYVGVEEKGKLVAATQFELHHTRLSTFAMIHNGPLCDFADVELTHYFIDQLAAFGKAKGAAQLEITPEAPYRWHASDGSNLPDPATGETWPADVPTNLPWRADETGFANLMSCGFIHGGFDRAYNAVPRWRYLKDLTPFDSEEALLGSFHKNTRRNVRIAQKSFVVVEKGTPDQLSVLNELCQISSDKQGFENRPMSYYELMLKGLGDDVEFLLAYIDMRAYRDAQVTDKASYAATVERLEAQAAEAPDNDKIARKLKDARKKLDSAADRIADAERWLAEDGERIPIAGAMFVWSAHECIYLFSGSNPKYRRFYGANAIQYRIMCETMERGLPTYNFYGINGVFDDPEDPGRGLTEFKQGFCGYVEEMMGSFTLPLKPARYAMKRLAHKILGH